MKILRTVSQGPILLVLIKKYFTRRRVLYQELWKSPSLYTCICSYGFYLSLKAFMVTTVTFIHNWKALNIFRPVENFQMISKQKYQN